VSQNVADGWWSLVSSAAPETEPLPKARIARHAGARWRPASPVVAGPSDRPTGDPDQVPSAVLAPIVSVRQVFLRFWPFTRGVRGWLALGICLVCVSIPLETLAIWLFKVLVDQVLTPRSFAAFPRVALAYLGLTLGMAALSFATGQAMTRATEVFLLTVRTAVLEHLQNLSMSFFERRKLGDLLSRLGGDVATIETLVLSGLTSAVSAGLQVIVFGVMLFVVDPLLAIAALTVSPLFWLISRYFSRRLKGIARQARHQVGELSSIAEESLSNVALVQAYNGQSALIDRFHAQGAGVVRTSLASSRLRGLYRPVVELVELLGLLLVVGVGTWQLSRGALTLGSLLVFMAYFAQLYGPLRGLGQLGAAALAASAGAERIVEVLDAAPDVVDDPRPWPVRRAHGQVSLDDVSFTYPGQDGPALRRVSFTAEPGQLVAVVGRSGSGKSTLTKLLLRFYDPSSGTVRLDGQDIRDLRVADLRDQLALVMQETLILDGTLRENIRWGRPGASDDALDHAVAASDVASIVADLPDGLDAQVGQRGRRLSGGQRQRVALARAIIRDAPVLLLDEPAAGLDPMAQQRVLAPLNRVRQGRTTILVSHDLLATRDADLILVMDRGQIVERGSYDELVSAGGPFQELLAAQLREGSPSSAVPVWDE